MKMGYILARSAHIFPKIAMSTAFIGQPTTPKTVTGHGRIFTVVAVGQDHGGSRDGCGGSPLHAGSRHTSYESMLVKQR